MIDPSSYNISVRRGLFEGEQCFEARVAELPDVVEYADSYSEAYELALDAIEVTAHYFAEQGRDMPLPLTEEAIWLMVASRSTTPLLLAGVSTAHYSAKLVTEAANLFYRMPKGVSLDDVPWHYDRTKRLYSAKLSNLNTMQMLATPHVNG